MAFTEVLDRAHRTNRRELASKATNRAFLDANTGGEGLVDAIADLAGTFVSVDVFCDACDALIDVDVTGDLAEVTAPSLVIVGEADMLTPADQGPDGAGGRAIYEGLTNARYKEYVSIPGSGHANLMDSPDECMAAIIPFLARVDAEG